MNTLDKFFREKVAEHSVPPSAKAWEKLEAGLSKKNNTILWWRWAAVLLIGMLLFGVLWLRQDDVPLPMAVEQKIPVVKPLDKTEIPVPKTEDGINKSVAVIKKEVSKKKTTREKPAENSQKEQQTIVQSEKEVIKQEIVVAEVTPAETAVAKKTRSIVLTYTLDPVEPKHTLPAEEVASADKKENSFKRVMQFAKDVKNGESHLGGLRVMKEDLFALELKKKNTSKTQ